MDPEPSNTGADAPPAGGRKEATVKVPAKDPKKNDDKKDEDLSEEDLALKQQLELYVERVQDSDPGLQRVALESMRKEIRSATSSMTSVPKPLKFLRPHYGTLKGYYATMHDVDLKTLLADILSVLALTMSAEGERIKAMDKYGEEKVKKYEEFVESRLKPDLVKAIAQRDKVFIQQKILSSDLKGNIQNLEKNSVTSLKTLVNLGSEVYMQAEVPDTQHIFVDVGLGFHVDFTWSEALCYIAAREERLAKQIEEHTRGIASIKAQIKLVCEGIRELLQIPV